MSSSNNSTGKNGLPKPRFSPGKEPKVKNSPKPIHNVKRDFASPKYKGIENEDYFEIIRDDVKQTSTEIKELLSLYRQKETERIPTDYFNTLQSEMDSDSRITSKMRLILFDWINSVAKKFTLLPTTLFLSFKLVDLFLSKKKINKHKFQAIGVVAMLIAGKYEEIFSPLIEDYEWISAKNVSRADILRIERIMSETLEWRVNPVTEYDFLYIYNEIINAYDDGKDDETPQFNERFNILQLIIFNEKYITLLPSLKAALALYIQVKMNGLKWNSKMKNWTQYSEGELNPYVKDFNFVFEQKNDISIKYLKEPINMENFKLKKNHKSPSKSPKKSKSPQSPSKSPKKNLPRRSLRLAKLNKSK